MAGTVQDSLRRIERLVAQEIDGQRVFDGVVEALGRTVDADAGWLIHFGGNADITILGVWSARDLSLPVGTRQAISDELRQLREAGQAYRVNLADVDPASAFGAEARRLGIMYSVGVPVWLAGQVWALAVVARFSPDPFPSDTEARMTRFVEPVTAALANAWTRARLDEWHDEREALRRLAERAVAGLRPTEVLHAVVAEASALVGGRAVVLARLEDDRLHAAVVAVSDDQVRVGRLFPTDGDRVVARVLRSGRPERIDDCRRDTGGLLDELGGRAVVAAPVEVDGQLWGLLIAVSPDEPLPVGTEGRLRDVAEVAVTALSIAATRAELQQLSDEQAALLRVSKLVARGAEESELFDSVVVEAAKLLGQAGVTLARVEEPGRTTVIATCGGPAAVGLSREVFPGDPGPAAEVIRTRQPTRRDSQSAESSSSSGPRDSPRSLVSVPIMVEGRVWGLLDGEVEGRRLPPETEDRLQQLAELVAAYVANGQARTEVVQLADEQAALRRVAELIARGASLQEVFAGVAVEASRLLSVGAALLRFDPDGYAEIVGAHEGRAQLGLRIPTTDAYIGRMFAVDQAERLPDYLESGFADAVRDLGLQPDTAVPIVVEGTIWGALKSSPSGAVVRLGAERNVISGVADKLEKFAALAAAAIANAENRAQLTASRARIVATADETRQRLQRDVHDGAQQRLVQTVLTLKLAQTTAQAGGSTDELIEEALGYAERATAELRDLVHGILPASLSRGGLRSGIESLIADLPMPVLLDFAAPRLPAGTEITAYFVVAEALTNVVKHAGATRADVLIGFGADRVTIEVRDNGVGGADAALGSGLTGLRDRVETAEGELGITSPPGAGTILHASLPVVAGAT